MISYNYNVVHVKYRYLLKIYKRSHSIDPIHVPNFVILSDMYTTDNKAASKNIMICEDIY